jgi:signal transduction histidine kinase
MMPLIFILLQHKDDLQHFLTNDPQGKHILEFIPLLTQENETEKQFLRTEVTSLKKNIGHVKSIIRMQQSLSHAEAVTEETSVNDLLEDAIALNKISYERSKIKIVRDIYPIKTVVIDKVKLLQILVNLIKNGIDALLASKNFPRKLLITLKEKDDKHFFIRVQDNGIGIKPQNIAKVFSHGFTTKPSGHGFGLHTSALDAEQMGGQLSAESEGENQGASFILTLPYQPNLKKGYKNGV